MKIWLKSENSHNYSVFFPRTDISCEAGQKKHRLAWVWPLTSWASLFLSLSSCSFSCTDAHMPCHYLAYLAEMAAYPHHPATSLGDSSEGKKYPSHNNSQSFSNIHRRGLTCRCMHLGIEEMLRCQFVSLECPGKTSEVSFCSLQISFHRCFILNLYL